MKRIDPPLELERTALGSYYLQRRLGSGVAGEVYLAERQDPQGSSARQVALKVIRGDVYLPMARSLIDQVSIVARLHPSQVTPIYEVGEVDGVLYSAMAYYSSGSLAAWYHRASASERGVSAVPGTLVASLIWDVAQALATCHEMGMIHGDLKPQNVFIVYDAEGKPTLELADFGQSQYVESLATRQGWGSAESLLYAAPEQIAGETVASSDQYSLASIAYLLLTGRPPQAIAPQSIRHDDVRHAVLPDVPLPAHTLNPLAPDTVDEVLLRALAREPIERYPSVLAFADELHLALCGVHAPTRRVAPLGPQEAELMATMKRMAQAAGPRAVGATPSGQHNGMRLPAVPVSEAPPIQPVLHSGSGATSAKGATKRLSLASLWHFVMYVVVGVASTVVNLICFQALYVYAGLPYAEQVRYFIAYLGSAETATMVNFLLNDRFTFAGYSGKQRPWVVRCLRFHTTVINGFILTFLVSGGLHYLLGVPALASQAVGIFVAFIFNFTLHHVWTYRARKQPKRRSSVVSSTAAE